jgi:hypothetical protein
MDDGDKPVLPTLAVGALFKGAKRIHINQNVCFHIPPSLRSSCYTLHSQQVYILNLRMHTADNKPTRSVSSTTN